MDDVSAAILAVALQRLPCAHPSVTPEYRAVIEEAITDYWPAHAKPLRCWWIAQLMAESSPKLDPHALSPAGARGLAQIMPATWAWITSKIGVTCSPWNAECSLRVGTAYFGRLLRVFRSPRPLLDLGCHGAVSYNAGVGSDLKAQARADSENCDEVLAVLHEVTGRHAKETRAYVARIRRWLTALYLGRRLDG